MKIIETERYTLVNGDCLEYMKTLPDESVDLVFTSPPYNMRCRIRNGQWTEREKAGSFSVKYDDFHDCLHPREYYRFHRVVITNLLRVSRLVFINIQIVTGSKAAWFRLIGDFYAHIKDIIIWDKGWAEPAMHDGVINRGSELILLLQSKKEPGRAFNDTSFSRGTMEDVWRIKRTNEKSDGHLASFPVGLPLKAIEAWTRPGDVVFDPFLGTGTTGVATMMLTDRRFIGSEISERYFDQSIQRIEDAADQPPLFTLDNTTEKAEQLGLFE